MINNFFGKYEGSQLKNFFIIFTSASSGNGFFNRATRVWKSMLRIRDVYTVSRIGIFPSRIHCQKDPGSGSASKYFLPKLFLRYGKHDMGCLSRIRTSLPPSRIPDPEGQKRALDQQHTWKLIFNVPLSLPSPLLVGCVLPDVRQRRLAFF